MIQSYKKNPELLDSYDTIIIGSGMGSLTTGAILAKEGQKVLILERHYTAGGFTHIFKRKGYEWDVGIHYIGEVQRPNSLTKKLFDYVSNKQLKWADMGSVYDRIVVGEKSYDYVKGVQAFKDQMGVYFPNEKKAIDDFVNLVFKANKTSRKFFAEKALSPFWSRLIGWSMQRKFFKYSDRTTYEVLRTITDNEELIKVLTGQYGDYGMPPKKGSFIMHAAVVRHYFEGGSFPIGGSSQIVKTAGDVIADAGGTILISAAVDKVIIKNNKAIGVRMTDGKELFGNSVVSGAGVMTTYSNLIPKEIIAQHNLAEKLIPVKPSASHACLYIGLNGSPEELKLPKTNHWVYPKDVDHDTAVANYLKDDQAPFPIAYMSFPSAKDPDWSNRYPGKSTIDIIIVEPFEKYKQWDGSRWMKRGEDYEAFKEKLAQRILKELYKILPHLEGKVDYYELSSPLTTKHFVNYDKGEIYGIDHSPKRFRQKFLRPRTPIKNFYLTGQDIVTAGVAGAMFAGAITASAMTKTNIVKKVMNS